MHAAHRRYLVLEQGLGAVLINFALNFAIAWAAFRGMSAVPMWGTQSIAGDTIGTSFVLPFLTCLIVTPLARREVTRGRLPAFERGRVDGSVLGLLPSTTFRRALVLGATATVLIAPIAIVAFHSAGLDGIEAGTFMWIKAAYAGVLAGIVTPLIAAGALADTGANQRR
jgi:hypothetical protein